MKYRLLALSVLALLSAQSVQAFTMEDFVGTWEGQYTSTTFGGSQFDMILDLQAGGFYTDSSGHLMPPYYYPDTQQWELDTATNRLHFWYLQSVYAGQRFYQHYYYEVVSFTGNTLELHYNFWDDPEPHPQAGTIILTRAHVAPVEESAQWPVPVLSGNYPNPFNPSTRIEFALPSEEFVSLKVFDVRGREVSTLVSGNLAEGSHVYTWNATGLSDGVYLYQLRAGDFTETRKMTLVK